MDGGGIFAAHNGDEQPKPENSIRTLGYDINSQIYQQRVDAINKISFSGNETISGMKPVPQAWVAKQRELNGTLLDDSESRLTKQLSGAKSREVSGHDIFAPPQEVFMKLLPQQNLKMNDKGQRGTIGRNFQRTPTGFPNNLLFGEESVVKTTKNIHAQKVAELTGNGIFKDNAQQGSAERKVSKAKLKEMSGDDIFADKKAPSRDYLGGVRKPPGGGSSITLV
ncbi:hypothetical protein Cni_G02029 [Canna indica]|uniref:DUF4057 domain-containing protein n=1 Tax=Canna indica TaxID=4628 RepID=A0AAQ3JQ90_9LILI|nr:hypothetical protein Cni_G02029 [Canna indica]